MVLRAVNKIASKNSHPHAGATSGEQFAGARPEAEFVGDGPTAVSGVH
jgi:hypothetical protein